MLPVYRWPFPETAGAPAHIVGTPRKVHRPCRVLLGNGDAGRGNVRALGVTDVLPSVRSSDEPNAGPPGGALLDVSSEVVAYLRDLYVEQIGKPLLDLLCTVAADHGVSEAIPPDVGTHPRR